MAELLVGLSQIADWLNGREPGTGVGIHGETPYRWIGVKGVRRLIREGGLPAKQIKPVFGPYTITVDAMIKWHQQYKGVPNAAIMDRNVQRAED